MSMSTRQVALDTETTGLSPSSGHRVIEIGCVEIINRKLTGNNLQFYINPERDIDEGAARVHGITIESLQDKPVFAAIAAEFMGFVSDAELIIHNASFDMGFLRHELKLLKQQNTWGMLDKHVIGVVDTLKMARKKHPGQRNNLDALCKRYNIKNSHRKLHGALLDSEILADLYLAMTRGQSSLGGFVSGANDAESNGAVRDFTVTKLASNIVPPSKVIKANAEELALDSNYPMASDS